MYDFSRQELEDGMPSSASEWDRADALQRGTENPEQAWVLSDRDVWHRNPFYTGAPVPHPEDDEARYGDFQDTAPAVDFVRCPGCGILGHPEDVPCFCQDDGLNF